MYLSFWWKNNYTYKMHIHLTLFMATEILWKRYIPSLFYDFSTFYFQKKSLVNFDGSRKVSYSCKKSLFCSLQGSSFKKSGKNTYKIFVVKTENGIQIQKSDCLQSSPANDGLWQPKSRIKPTSISARLGGQNEAGGQSQSKAAISN